MHVSRTHAQILTAPVELPRHAAESSGVIGILASIGGLFSINPIAMHDGGMLDVLCTASEQAEYGEVLVVGDRLERLAVTITPNFYGTELDEIELVFDRFAQVASGGRKTATISGVIVSIDAAYVSLTRKSLGWAPAVETATLERLETTAATRRPERRIVWGGRHPRRMSTVTRIERDTRYSMRATRASLVGSSPSPTNTFVSRTLFDGR
ncbi:hypothetical protein [Cryobacterium sp. PH31-L1]|uniref:hypothetical protein n=1 Tax=Cryobacterium sp. PH31-L1 TaxID=3046199 RepID=UPI0024BABA9D|nr:hypothetical protein [Cryobacterium sp. PH31-L1]MDJ0377067.1 hypothetical protein [Cryobacterium sp. PH31-L1]